MARDLGQRQGRQAPPQRSSTRSAAPPPRPCGARAPGRPASVTAQRRPRVGRARGGRAGGGPAQGALAEAGGRRGAHLNHGMTALSTSRSDSTARSAAMRAVSTAAAARCGDELHAGLVLDVGMRSSCLRPTSVMQMPVCPARPVRPERWMYVSVPWEAPPAIGSGWRFYRPANCFDWRRNSPGGGGGGGAATPRAGKGRSGAGERAGVAAPG
jgi:hypothetical protein